MADSAKKKITICAGSTELKFQVGIADFNKLQNDMLPNNKVAPSENFLMACIDESQKQELVDLFDQGFGLELSALVAAEFKPDMELTVKK
ncbi:MAG: putative phage tail assembly chaperone [Cycloclasticus sp.]